MFVYVLISGTAYRKNLFHYSRKTKPAKFWAYYYILQSINTNCEFVLLKIMKDLLLNKISHFVRFCISNYEIDFQRIKMVPPNFYISLHFKKIFKNLLKFKTFILKNKFKLYFNYNYYSLAHENQSLPRRHNLCDPVQWLKWINLRR